MLDKNYELAIEFAQKITYIDPYNINQLIRYSRQLKTNRQISTIKNVYDTFGKIIMKIPNDEINIAIEFTNKYCDFLIEFGKLYSKFALKYFDGITLKPEVFGRTNAVKFTDTYVFVMAMYSTLSERLVNLGISGEAHNTLMKAMDPWIKIFNRDEQTGDKYLYNENLFWGIQAYYALIGNVSRETMVGKYGLHLENLSVLGNIDNNVPILYIKVKPYLKLTKDITIYDVKFLLSCFRALTNNKQFDDTYNEIAQTLNSIYCTPDAAINRYFKFIIAFEFAKTYKTEKWINEAIKLFSGTRKIEKRLYLNLLLIQKNPNKEDEIIKLIKDFLLVGKKENNTRIQMDLFKKRHSNFFLEAITYLYEHKKWVHLVEASFIWKGYTSEFDKVNLDKIDISNKNIFIYILNKEKPFFLIYSKGLIEVIEPDVESNFLELIKLKDKLENSWTSLLGEIETLQPKDLPKMDIKVADEYENSLRNYVKIDILKDKFKLFDNEKFECIEVSWTNIPLISLLNSEISQPLHVSKFDYGEKIDKELTNILIWANPDSSLFRAYQELDALENILNLYGIQYTLYSGDDCTKEKFMQEYQKLDYDLIWIITHGNFNYDNPTLSNLIVSEDESITVEELEILTGKINKERCLVLNACQSATSELRFNSMGFNSIAGTLANRYQSVIGHLWPIDSFASAIFGSLLIKYIINEKNFVIALKKATLAIQGSKEDIIKLLNEDGVCLEISTRFDQSDITFNNLFYSKSSLIFY